MRAEQAYANDGQGQQSAPRPRFAMLPRFAVSLFGLDDEHRKPSLFPWLLFLFLGSAALGAWLLIAPAFGSLPYYRVGYHTTPYSYIWAVIPLFIPYGLALLAWRRGARAPMWLLLGGAVFLHLMVLFAPPPQSQDFYSYLFYGKIQAAHGANPYLIHPRMFWNDGWFAWARWHDQPSVYGPAWMLVTWGIVKVTGARSLPLASVALKLVILAIDLAVLAMIASAGRARKEEPGADRWNGFGLLAFAWNPMILISIPLAGAVDVGLAAAFIGAILARRRGRMGWTTVLLTLAALVKAYAVIGLLFHLVLLTRERGWLRTARHVLVAVGLGMAAYAPYWASPPALFHGLLKAIPLTNRSLIGTIQRVLAAALHMGGLYPTFGIARSIMRFVAGGLLLGAAVWALRRIRDERTMWESVVFVLIAYLLLTPWFLYWYTVAPLAMLLVLPRNRMTYPVLTFSGTSLILVSFPPLLLGMSVQTALRYGPPFVVFARQGRRERAVGEGGAPLPVPAPTAERLPQEAPAAK